MVLWLDELVKGGMGNLGSRKCKEKFLVFQNLDALPGGQLSVARR